MSDTDRRSLKVGLFIALFEGFMNGNTAAWADILEMARKAEEVGFDSIWLPDHFLLHDDPNAEPLGVWECTTMLAALAATTRRVELGTLVMCTGFRNPAMLAKMADTIDEISGGRLILGLGAGYHDPEHLAFGYPTDRRVGRFAEAIHIIHGLLRDGRIDFQGAYYQARGCVLRPRGPRPGGIPIMVGGRGPRALRLTAQYADLWNGFLLRGHSRPEDLEPLADSLDAACKAVDRDPATLGRTVSVHWNAARGDEVIPLLMTSRYGRPLTGGPDDIADVFRAFARAGVSHIQVIVWPHTPAGVEAFGPILASLDSRN